MWMERDFGFAPATRHARLKVRINSPIDDEPEKEALFLLVFGDFFYMARKGDESFLRQGGLSRHQASRATVKTFSSVRSLRDMISSVALTHRYSF
jgi:hypothetical protein